MGNKIWLIEDGERHWCVAPTGERAEQILAVDTYGFESVSAWAMEAAQNPTVREWTDPLTVHQGDGSSVYKSAAKWAETESGVFCSTVW